MSQMESDRTGGQPGPATEQAKEKARETTQQAQEKTLQASQQAQEKAREFAGQARGQAMERTREQVDQRSTQAGEQLSSVAQAVRQSGEQLRSEGKSGAANVVDQAADRADRLGSYLKESDADRIVGDVQDFARRQPWLVAAGGFVLGLLGSRFVKASSSRQPGDGRAGEEPGTYSPPPYEARVEAPVAPAPVPPVVEPAVPPSATAGGVGDVEEVER